MPHEKKILEDPSTSFWLKEQIKKTELRDPNDVINDLEILQKIVEIRLLNALTQSGVEVPCEMLSGSLVQL